jgi:hypothetical protein
VARRNSRKRSLTETFSDSAVMNRAVTDAVRGALDTHRRAGNKVAVLRDGKVIKVNPRKVTA